jgi:hypothetical protein
MNLYLYFQNRLILIYSLSYLTHAQLRVLVLIGETNYCKMTFHKITTYLHNICL